MKERQTDPIGYIAGYAARIISNGGAWDSFSFTREKCDESDIEVYLHKPRQTVQLSDDEIGALATDDLYDGTLSTSVFAYKQFARAVIAAYEEKQR